MKLQPLIASIEGLLVFLAIVVLSALSNWIKQRKELQEQQQRRNLAKPSPEGQPLAPPGPPAPPAPPPLDWQEQLRRLLEGEPEMPEPVPPPEPRAPAAETAPHPAPAPKPPPTSPRPPPIVPPVPRPAVRPRPAVQVPPHKPEPVPVIAEWTDAPAQPTGDLARLDASAAAYKRASELSVETAAKLERLAHLPGLAGPRGPVPRHGVVSHEASQVRALLKTPRTTRQAVMVSVILGQPRALEETPQTWWAAL